MLGSEFNTPMTQNGTASVSIGDFTDASLLDSKSDKSHTPSMTEDSNLTVTKSLQDSQ